MCHSVGSNRTGVHELEAGFDDEEYVIDSVLVDIYARGEIFASIAMKGKKIEMKFNTGVKCNVMAESPYNMLRKNERIDSKKSIKLVAY